MGHRQNISLHILCTRLPWNHRSPITNKTLVYAFYVPDCRGIIDHRSQTAQPVPNSCIDHRSPTKHKSTHFMYQTAVESSITDHKPHNRFQTVVSITDHRQNISLRILCTRLPWDHRSPITNRSTGSKQLYRSPITDKTLVYAFCVPDCRGIIDHRSQTAQPVPNSC